MLCISAAIAVMRCPSVRLSIRLSRLWIMSKRMNISSKFFSPSGSHTILVFPYQTGWRYSDGNPPNGGVECRWGISRNRDSDLIAGYFAFYGCYCQKPPIYEGLKSARQDLSKNVMADTVAFRGAPIRPILYVFGYFNQLMEKNLTV